MAGQGKTKCDTTTITCEPTELLKAWWTLHVAQAQWGRCGQGHPVMRPLCATGYPWTASKKVQETQKGGLLRAADNAHTLGSSECRARDWAWCLCSLVPMCLRWLCWGSFPGPLSQHSKEDVACVHHSRAFPSINMWPPDAAYKDAPFHDVKVHDGGNSN